MKKLIVLIAFFIIYSCSSPQIILDENSIKKIHKIIVFPFQSRMEISDVIRDECESIFISKLATAGFSMIDQNKINSLLIEKKITSDELTPQEMFQISQTLGADTILQGEILENSEENTLVRDYENEPARIKKLLVFQIEIKMINVDSGKIILTIQNDNPQIILNTDDPDANIKTHRSIILKEISKNLVSALKK